MASTSSESVAPANGADLSAPTRIKRNTACVRCRDAKVKCNASLNPGQRCLRCSKLDLDCVVDKSHKRASRRSKLEELAAELRNIKEAVVASGPAPTNYPAVAPSLRPSQLQSPPVREMPYIGTGGILPPYSTPPTSNLSCGGGLLSVDPQSESSGPSKDIARPRAAAQVAEPRALGSTVFSGEDIDYYFDKYFEHFHPFMPIVRVRDPDACYNAAPVLFWAVMITACRRYAKRESTFQFLVNTISPEISSAIASAPVRPAVITALLILSTWSLPSIRFMNDPTYVYTGVALNSSLYLGLHTGKGDYLELGTRYDTSATDEEATYIWAASNIVSQRTSSYLGFPPTAPFTGKALHGIIDGTSAFSIPRSFAINLAAAKFSNELLKFMSAGLEDGPGISYHLVAQMEEEFVKLQRSLHDGTPDVDDFMLRSTLLEVQVLYWMPLPGRSDETLQRNLTRTYSTSEGLIKLALDLEHKYAFLTHAPHFVFRSLFLAACTIVSYLRSPPFRPPSLDTTEEIDLVVQNVIKALKTCSVQAEDLPIRATNVMQGYWSVRDRLPPWDICQLRTAKFRHRLGASIMFECLSRWKRDIQRTRDASHAGGLPDANSGNATLAVGQNVDLGLSDPLLQGVDWTSFMDDFEWNFTPCLTDLKN